MTKRIITKIGDIFCVEVDNDYKCYFQYVANDMTVLNSSVIRVFAKHYPIDYAGVRVWIPSYKRKAKTLK